MNETTPIQVGASEKLRAAAADMEAAIKEEGFDQQGPLAVFARYQRQSIEDLGGIVASAEKMIAARLAKVNESINKWESVEREKIERLFKGGDKALDMAMEAAKAAAAAESLSAANRDLAVTRMAKTMSEKLFGETQKWMVLKQTARHRWEARRFAAIVSAVVVGLLLTGYQLRAWQDDPATEALGRCAVEPLMVKVGNEPPKPACYLPDLSQRELKNIPAALGEWIAGFLP